MAKMFHILDFCAILATCVILVSCGWQWGRVDPEVTAILSGPGVLELFAERAQQRDEVTDG